MIVNVDPWVACCGARVSDNVEKLPASIRIRAGKGFNSLNEAPQETRFA
jgi:hypothetical protein